MILNTKYSTALLILLAAQTMFSQKKDENIGTEVVNVVKPYTPTISDAFKLKETPKMDDEDNEKKEEIKYNIFSFPVASTFTPSKGRAAGVDKKKSEQLYPNFATFGVGNYGTILGELYVTREVGDNSYISGMLRHLSSEGGVKNIFLDDDYRDSSLDLTYGYNVQNLSWKVDAGYQNQSYNWYGLPKEFAASLSPEAVGVIVHSINPQHTYHNFNVGSVVELNESIFNRVEVKYNRFWDSYKSEENRLIVKPKISFDINDLQIQSNFVVDYVGGSFNKPHYDFTPANYGFANIGIQPSFSLVRNDWSFNIGASAFYSMDLENDKSSFYIYPNVTASIDIVGDLMVFYAGAEGGLQQNSYRDFTNINSYMSPEFGVAPTDRQYDFFAGLKGKLASSVGYNIRASYTNERNKAFFKSNDYNEQSELPNYAFGNSFGIAYGNLRTISFYGELKADFTDKVSAGINGSFSDYGVDGVAEAWNMPAIKIGANLEVAITDKISAGTDLFFTGERKDIQQFSSLVGETGVRTLESYFDANIHVNYKFSDRLNFFLRGNNLANKNYEKWLDYPVQGLQGVIGASYKFDF